MKMINYLDKTLKILSISALCLMIVLVFFNALLRYFFDSGIAWSEEFSRICFVYMIFLGIILVAKERGHLTVDILITSLPSNIRKFVQIISDILVLIAIAFLTVGAYHLIQLTYVQKMPATGISSAFLYIAAIVSSIFYLLIVFLGLVKNIKSLLKIKGEQ